MLSNLNFVRYWEGVLTEPRTEMRHNNFTVKQVHFIDHTHTPREHLTLKIEMSCCSLKMLEKNERESAQLLWLYTWELTNWLIDFQELESMLGTKFPWNGAGSFKLHPDSFLQDAVGVRTPPGHGNLHPDVHGRAHEGLHALPRHPDRPGGHPQGRSRRMALRPPDQASQQTWCWSTRVHHPENSSHSGSCQVRTKWFF